MCSGASQSKGPFLTFLDTRCANFKPLEEPSFNMALSRLIGNGCDTSPGG